MKFRISSLFKEKNIPAIIAAQTMLCVYLLVSFLVIHSRNEARIKDAILCDFFVNVIEWQSGHQDYISPDLEAQNEQGAQRVYRRVLEDEHGLCREGLCLDSSRITLYKSCPDNTAVQILKDTIIYY